MRTFIRGDLLTPEQTVENGVLVIEGNRIVAIESGNQVTRDPQDARVIDAEGLLVIPGLIDVHVHGGDGSDTMDASPQALAAMSSFFLRHGVTAYLPTTMTATVQATQDAIDTIARYKQGAGESQILGAHLEGPYLSPTYRGAQPVERLRDPDPSEYKRWFESAIVRRITVAPELPGALDFIQEGVARGVYFSTGHTEATFDQVQQAVQAGLTQATHTFNGMSGLHHREPGTVGAVLSDERVFCEAIADGIHVHPAVLRLMAHAKGVERMILVTDAMRATGLEDGEYDLGGQPITVQGGVARTATGSLAGSTLTLDRAVKNIAEFAGLSINQAISMATSTPAAAIGLAGRKGSLQPGADADIVFVDREMNVKTAMVGGKIAYQAHLND